MGKLLGKYIRNLRQGKGISVSTLREKAGISKSYLDYIESGVREPQIEVLTQIAVALDSPLEIMINIQIKDQVENAITKLSSTGNVSGKDSTVLTKLQTAFKEIANDQQLAEYAVNPELRAIMRIITALPDKELNRLRKVIEALYSHDFNDI